MKKIGKILSLAFLFILVLSSTCFAAGSTTTHISPKFYCDKYVDVSYSVQSTNEQSGEFMIQRFHNGKWVNFNNNQIDINVGSTTGTFRFYLTGAFEKEQCRIVFTCDNPINLSGTLSFSNHPSITW